MKDLVSSNPLSVYALFAGLSVVWAVCSFLFPYGFAWMGLGWAGLAILAALWVSISSPLPIAQVLRDVEAETLPAVAAKFPRLAAAMWVNVACLSLLPVSSFAGTPDPGANLSACKNGRASCERSRLTLVQMTEVTLAEHARNIWTCRNGLSSCDRSKLTNAEAIATAVAAYDRNVSNCSSGWDESDSSKLNGREAAEVEAAILTRNMSDCMQGRDSCDYTLLSRSAAQAIASAERVRNYTACLNRRGCCDLARLTPSEAASIPPEVR